MPTGAVGFFVSDENAGWAVMYGTEMWEACVRDVMLTYGGYEGAVEISGWYEYLLEYASGKNYSVEIYDSQGNSQSNDW